MFRAVYLLVMLFCLTYLGMQAFRHTDWYKERLYGQLRDGSHQQRVRAASALAQLGAEDRLLEALQIEMPEAREMARRALEYFWFNQAGREAFRLLETAYHASEQEEYDQALVILNQLTEQFPQFAEGWNRRAAVHWQRGDCDRSIADSERALTLNPHHYGAWQGIGMCRLRQGNVAEACRCLRAALEIVPHDAVTQQALQRCEELLRVYPPPDSPDQRSDLI